MALLTTLQEYFSILVLRPMVSGLNWDILLKLNNAGIWSPPFVQKWENLSDFLKEGSKIIAIHSWLCNMALRQSVDLHKVCSEYFQF